MEDSRGTPITHVSTDRVLLSFDDGPRSMLTLRILDTLHEFGVHACFFILGQRGAQHPQLLRRIVEEGHELGNHTWSHPRLLKTPDAAIFGEIQKTQSLIEAASGKPVRFFRPPYGKIRPKTVEMIQERFNMQTMLWSLDPEDWSSPGVDVIHANVIEKVRGGDIVLLHEKRQTAQALPAILSSLRDRNLMPLKTPAQP